MEVDSRMGSLETECLDALAVRRLFVFMKENLNFEYLQDELIQRELLHKKEKDDYVCKTKSKHFWIEKLVKLIIKKRRCKEFVAFINDMPCHKHISEKIVEVQENTGKSSSDLLGAAPSITLSDALLQKHSAFLYTELEPREIADEMFQAGHITVSEHDDVTECTKKCKRLKCLLDKMKEKQLYGPFVYTLQSLKYTAVLDVLQQDKKSTRISSEHGHCIQYNFTLLQEELPEPDNATVIMEHILDQSNISDIECCIGARRQKSKLLKILLMKGNPACMELLRVVEVDLKREDLLQKMRERSAYIEERGKPDLSHSLRSLEISCLQERKKVLHDELDPFDLSDLLFEERAMEIIAHDKITESSLRSKQIKYLLETINENENDCFHFFLYILQREEYKYILKNLFERPAPKVERSESIGTLKWRLLHSVKKVPDGVLNKNISVRLSVEGCSKAHVEQSLFQRIQSPDSGVLEEAIVHGQMIAEDIYPGSIVLRLRPVTDEAAQTLLNAKDNNKLLEMIFGILKKVNVENIMDVREPLKIKVQVHYAKSSKEKQDAGLSKVALIKKRVKIHSNVLVSELEPRALASLLSKSTNFTENVMHSVNNVRSCKEKVETILSLVEDGNSEVVEDFMTALKDLGYWDILELIDPPDIHSKAENIRKVITSNYKHILNEMQMALVRETLSKCIGDVDSIRDKCLPRNGQRRQRMSCFLQFVLQDDHNVIEFENVMKKNGLDKLLRMNGNVEGDHNATPNIEVTVVEEGHNSLSSKEVLFESIITLSYTDEETENRELSIPVQCVSDEEEYRLAESLNFNELLSGDLHGEKNISDKDGVKDTEAKSVIATEENEAFDTDLKRTYQNASAEEQDHVSEEDKQICLETFEERLYQNELALPAQRGQNCIIIAPTGSGKTIVAVKIIKDHLKNREIQRDKKIAFVVEKNNLATQQSETIKRYIACKLTVVSGDTMRDEDFRDLAVLLSQFDVFVITAQMLVNAMAKGNSQIESFSLIIFDECHHCHGGHAFYKTMIPYHDKKLDDSEERSILPQIVGFTASIGVGKANTKGQVINHIKTMMANLDADALVSVKENFLELFTKMNTPDNSILKIPKRKIDQFGEIIKDLMMKTEDCLALIYDKLPDKNALNPPSTKGSEEYTQWLQTSLMDAGVKADRDLSPFLFTVRRYLEIYNEALIVHCNARASDALSFILQNIQDLQTSDTDSEIEMRAKTLFENVRAELNICATDDQKCEENPLLLKLKEIILETYREESNMRGIVFVRTRVVADIIASWMEETEELKHIKARKYTGTQARGTDGENTKNKQKETIKLFTKGDFKVIVATTIAEEDSDIKECNLVVKYDYAGNLISQIQAKGRGRAENSRFFILASEDKCVAERELTNSLKEPMMEEAIDFVQHEIQTENEKYQMEKQELQRQAKRERDAAVHNQGSRTSTQRQCVLRCLKCNQYLCLSNELKKIGFHFACVSEKLKNHVTFEKSEDIIFEDKKIKIGVGIVKCKCGEKIGNVALHKGIHFPMLLIKAIKIEDDMKGFSRQKQWKKVEEEYFTVSPLSTRDFKKISESGKLVDMD